MTKRNNDEHDAMAFLDGALHKDNYDLARKMAKDLVEMLNDWHSKSEVYDSKLDSEIHRWYVNPPTVKQFHPLFRPSSTSSDPRELYEKLMGSYGDSNGQDAYRGRWTRIGTAIGDIIQRDILFIEKHADNPKFKFEWTNAEKPEARRPMFEDFAKRCVPVKYRDKLFYLAGSPDGIMQYTTDDGEIIRVGLEIKSKQTTYAQTGHYSMKTANESHVGQSVTYSMMFGLDYYIILYVNASHKGWFMTPEDVNKYPDIRAFGHYFTDEDKREVLDKFVGVLEDVERGTPPPIDLDKWTFNNFKTAVARSVTDDEMEVLRKQVEAVKESALPAHLIVSYVNSFQDLERLREIHRFGKDV